MKLDTTAIMQISGAVIVLCQLAKAGGVSGRFALLTAAVLSALGVWLWGVQYEAFAKTAVFDLFAGWVVVLASAAGVFNLISSGPEAVATITGGVKGAVVRMGQAVIGHAPKE